MSYLLSNHGNMESNSLNELISNRAQLLYRLREYENCLKDIGLMTDTNDKLLNEIKQDCCEKLKRKNFQFIRIIGESKNRANKSFCEEQAGVSDCSFKKLHDDCDTLESSDLKTTEIKVSSESEQLQNASDCVKLTYDPIKGRILKAAKHIKQGTVLVAEEAFCFWLRPSLYDSYCHNCLHNFGHRYFYCSSCFKVRFCSVRCLQRAWSLFHRIECAFIEILKEWSMSHFALRMTLIVGADNAIKIMKEKQKPLEKWNSFRNDYRSISSLIGDEKWTEPSTIYSSLAVSAAFLTILAERMKLIARESSEYYSFAALMLKHSMQVLKNTFVIYNQNVTNDEVTVNYGAASRLSSLKDRQQYLKANFDFDCKCDDCEQKVECFRTAIRCPKCRGAVILNHDLTNQCAHCKCENIDISHASSRIDDGHYYLSLGITYFQEAKLKMAKDFFSKCAQLFASYYYSSVRLNDVNKWLATCYERENKLDKAFEHLIQTVDSSRAIHGERSLQVVNSLIMSALLLQLSADNCSLSKESKIKRSKELKEEGVALFKQLIQYECQVASADTFEFLEYICT
ncbi:SET and MYND domain-containing protein 4-like protein [Dinothrombium tinctorium]|uniref:SET and MYND domain-containing protein 4-like protein n=1 Tax=Dinothrombium tinctorium TaxID=1965070 RepID=A0A443RL71_9ACAR|nr:SET and MYND domain-containing protein 4-like protein [Dinothrombium tinctorium]